MGATTKSRGAKNIFETKGSIRLVFEGIERVRQAVTGFKGRRKPAYIAYLQDFEDELSNILISALNIIITNSALVKDGYKGRGKYHILNGLSRWLSENPSLDVCQGILTLFLEESGLIEARLHQKNATRKETLIHISKQLEDVLASYIANVYECPLITLTDKKAKDWTGFYNEGRKAVRGQEVPVRSEQLDVLNTLQNVGWKINVEVLEIAKRWVKNNQPNIPALSEEGKSNLEAYRNGVGILEKGTRTELKVIKKMRGEHAAWNRKLSSVVLAKKLSNHDSLYCYWNFDFRGRIYAEAANLSPQGGDIEKGLLQFSVGEKLTKNGEAQAYACLASLYGHDKESFKTKEGLGRKFVSEWDWEEAEEPFCFLAWQEYLRRYEADNNELCYLSIPKDATCSGIQHLSALTLDKVGGLACNLTGNERSDIYLNVAARAAKKCTGLIKEAIKQNGRKICKRPTMIFPYAATFDGARKYIANELEDWDWEEITELSKIVWAAVKDEVKGGGKVMEWIKKGVVGDWEYKAHDGFICRPHYPKMKSKSLYIKYKGKSTEVCLKEATDKTDIRKLKTSSAPNIIHLLDGCHMRMVIRALKKEGVANYAMIHDSFGVSPNNSNLLDEVVRAEFVRLYSSKNILEDVKNQLGIALETPKRGELNLKDILENEFNFS